MASPCPNETPNVKSSDADYVVGTDDACECYGGVIYQDTAMTAGNAIIACDGLADGMNFTVIANVAGTVIVDTQSDDMAWLDGTTIGDGDSIDSGGTLGEIAVFGYYSATGWYIASDGWSDGGTN